MEVFMEELVMALSHITASLVICAIGEDSLFKHYLNFSIFHFAKKEQDFHKKLPEKTRILYKLMALSDLLTKEFDSKLLKNRIADISGVILKFWIISIQTIMIGGFLMLLWNVFTVNLEYAIFSWLLVIVFLFRLFTTVLWIVLTVKFTGMVPLEPERWRRFIILPMNNQIEQLTVKDV